MNISSFYQEIYQWRQHGIAVLSVALALLVEVLLNFVSKQENPLLIFFAAVLVSALYGGTKVGVLATFLAALISDYFFLSPEHSFINPTLGQNLQLLIFVTEGISISLMFSSLNSTNQRTDLSKQQTLHNGKPLNSSEESFQLLVKEVKDYAIFMINTNGQITTWNAGGKHIFGYEDSEIIGHPLSCIFTSEAIHSGLPKEELQTATLLGQAYEECQHVRQDGTSFWASGVVTALRDEAGNMRGFSKVVRNITERKEAEVSLQEAKDGLELEVERRTTQLRIANENLQTEIVEREKSKEALQQSDERLRMALQVNQAGTWDWDMITNEFIWCPEHELLFGLPPKTFDGTQESFLKGIHPEDRQLVLQELTRAIESRVDYVQEYRIVRSDGSIRWLAVKGRVFCDQVEQPMRMVGLSVDITRLKSITEQLAASLKEKEVLLKEIHHRVKNNLQIISSLLSLQSGYIEEQKTIEILLQCENRIGAMALIHEHLYQSQDLAKIEFAEYVKTLTANLLSSYGISSDTIFLKVDVNDVFLSVDAAIPCGLIINELVSNSLKYAFPQAHKGEIRVALNADNNNHLTLKASDNGIGFSKNLDFRNTESLGLQIVMALVNQLEGTIELNTDNGTNFEIKF